MRRPDFAKPQAIDLFKGQHKPGPDLTMVESFVVRARKLATMSEQTFLASYGQVFRALPYLPGSPEDNVRQIYELHRRHGQQVIQIVDRELKNNASLVQTLSVPVTSLLGMIISPVAKQPDYIDPIEAEQPASAQAATDIHTIVAQPVVFAIDHGTQCDFSRRARAEGCWVWIGLCFGEGVRTGH